MKCRTKFERKSAELKDLTSKILALLSEEEYEEELGRSLRDDYTVMGTLTDLDIAITKLERLEFSQNVSNQPNPNQSTLSNSKYSNFNENEQQNLEILNYNGSNILNSQVKVKLPKVELKPFEGDIIKWKPFRNQFNASIHSNNLISKIEKFSYLKTFLNESASSCISGLTLATGNYDEAVKILEERFGNTQILISAFMQQFVSLPKIKSAYDISGLRNLFDKIENSVRNLKILSV